MGMEMSSRERVLKLFNKEKVDRLPIFSGMGNITVHGLEGAKHAQPAIQQSEVFRLPARSMRFAGGWSSGLLPMPHRVPRVPEPARRRGGGVVASPQQPP